MNQDLETSLTRINQASDANRIKLEALRGAYIQLAQCYHLSMCKVSAQDNFKSCIGLACTSNRNVLEKLGLL